jgi:glycerate dehydrogenase
MNHTANIVVLDGHALNPGDLSWVQLQELGACMIYPRTSADEFLLRARPATILLTNKTPIDSAALAALPSLQYIGILATGYNVVDVKSAKARNIIVANVPAYGTSSVAQHVFALILELAQHTGRHTESVKAGNWASSPDWCYWETPLLELEGLTLGIVGSGRIGRSVAKIGEAFGMRTIFATRQGGPASLAAVLETADIVSLHCPLTEATKHIINAASLAKMKRSAFLINTSRGPLIDEVALASALNAGCIAGAGLDVLSSEPPSNANPLIGARNCLITPHIAWATKAARTRLLTTAVNNVRAFLNGHPENIVSG